MTYLSRNDATTAIGKMKAFHDDLSDVMTKNGFNILENLGRRNILLSQAQEKFFSESLAKKFKVTCDGRTGEPDIMINTLGRELECKLTSRHKSGAISFQTDYETLLKKEKLDYLYVVANESFDKFAVIHYTDLTIKDFRPLSTGARGKTQMLKYAAHDRANILLGNFVDLNKKELIKLQEKMKFSKTPIQKERIRKSISYWENSPTKFKIELEAIND